MGSASAISILSGIIKNKVAALLLGPSGFGFLAMLQSALGIIATIAGAGLTNSGVQQIATSNNSANPDDVAHAKKALFVASIILGFLGAAATLLFREQLAYFLLSNKNHSNAIVFISIGIITTSISGAQTAFLNGLHKIPELAKVSVCSSLGSMLITIIALWQLGVEGVFMAVLSIPVSSLAASWWFSKKVQIPEISFNWREVYPPLRKMLSLGFVFMTTSLMVVGNQFLVRVIITQKIGLEATGHFQAAWTISMMYLGFILNAMSADYYPRLSAVSHDNKQTRILVNDQTEVALLLAAPVILGMITFSPTIINLLYSASFADSSKILRWQLIGDVFKLASWTMAYVLLSSNFSRLFFWAELSFHVVYLSLIWFGVRAWGLEITGLSFLISYAYYFLLIWFIVKRLINFYWNKEVIILFVSVLICGTAITVLIKWGNHMMVSSIITVIVGVYSVLRLSRITGGLHLSKIFNRG